MDASHPGRGIAVHRKGDFDNRTRASSVFAVDLNGDGDIDVLSASRLDDKIAWYENDGGSPSTFTERVISNVADGASAVYALDMDGDGDIDVFSTSDQDWKISWYENDGGSSPIFTEHIINTGCAIGRSVFAADLDSDGDVEVFCVSALENEIRWFDNDGEAIPSFQTRIIPVVGIFSIFLKDIDGDEDIDIVAAVLNADKVAWYENDGGSPPAFTEHVISPNALSAISVYAADVNGDGNIDVVSAEQAEGEIMWYESDGGSPPVFSEHLISNTAIAASFVFAIDTDGDGDIDVLSTSAADDKVAWYENSGGSSPTFTEHVISTNANAARSLFAADLDGDGDIDALFCVKAGRQDCVVREHNSNMRQRRCCRDGGVRQRQHQRRRRLLGDLHDRRGMELRW